jgi:hypothetical protein
MTGSTKRKFYRRFLRLYPEPFRHEFGDEMLSMFDECRVSQGLWRLLADVLFSAAKQQIQYFSAPVPTSAPLYSETDLSLPLARLFAIAALVAAMITAVSVKGNRKAPGSWTMVRPEAVYWFPIVPRGRHCYGPPEHTTNPESVFTTGVWVTGNPEAPQSRTVVRSKTRFWISTTPWGQYCLDVPERRGSSEGVL